MAFGYPRYPHIHKNHISGLIHTLRKDRHKTFLEGILRPIRHSYTQVYPQYHLTDVDSYLGLVVLNRDNGLENAPIWPIVIPSPNLPLLQTSNLSNLIAPNLPNQAIWVSGYTSNQAIFLSKNNQEVFIYIGEMTIKGLLF